MTSRGRQPGFRMSDEHRTKIANSQILKCLIEHATGQREMSASQVTAGLGLMKKVLPDLVAAELSGEVVTRIVRDKPLSAAEWAARHAADE